MIGVAWAGARTWIVERRWALIFSSLLIALYVRNLAGLTTAPPGSYIDESSIAYNAWAVANHGVDEHGVALPLYFEAFGDFKNPVYVYMVAIFTRLFGMSVFVERLPAALCGMAACGFLCLAVRRVTASNIAAALLLLMAGLTPWMTLESRVGFEVISMVMFLCLMLWCLSEAAVDLSWRWYVGGGAAAAMAIFAYSTARLEVGLFAGAYFLAYIWPLQKRWWAAIPPVVAGYSVLGLWMLGHPGDLTARYDLISITKNHGTGANLSPSQFLPVFWDNYKTYISSTFLFVTGDANLRHNTQWGGMLLVVTGVMLIPGVLWIRAHWHNPVPRFALICVLLAPIAASLTDNGTPHSLRAVTMLPFLLFIAGCGIAGIAEFVATEVRRKHMTPSTGRTVRVVALVAVTLGIAVPGTEYVHDLYANFPTRAAGAFDTGEMEAIAAAHNQANGATVYLIADGYLDQPYIQAAMLYATAPPTQPTEDNVPVLMGEIGMAQVGSVDDARKQAGNVIVLAASEAQPDGTTRIFANDYAAVYRVDTAAAASPG